MVAGSHTVSPTRETAGQRQFSARSVTASTPFWGGRTPTRTPTRSVAQRPSKTLGYGDADDGKGASCGAGVMIWKAPPELCVFNGRQYTTAAEWEAAFEEYCRARERWLAERGLIEFDVPAFRAYAVDGDCPFDPSAI